MIGVVEDVMIGCVGGSVRGCDDRVCWRMSC